MTASRRWPGDRRAAKRLPGSLIPMLFAALACSAPGAPAQSDQPVPSAAPPALSQPPNAGDRQARALDGAVFFITGRPESRRAATGQNLRNGGHDAYARLYMAPEGARYASAAAFKAPVRAAIEAEGHTISPMSETRLPTWRAVMPRGRSRSHIPSIAFRDVSGAREPECGPCAAGIPGRHEVGPLFAGPIR